MSGIFKLRKELSQERKYLTSFSIRQRLGIPRHQYPTPRKTASQRLWP